MDWFNQGMHNVQAIYYRRETEKRMAVLTPSTSYYASLWAYHGIMGGRTGDSIFEDLMEITQRVETTSKQYLAANLILMIEHNDPWTNDSTSEQYQIERAELKQCLEGLIK